MNDIDVLRNFLEAQTHMVLAVTLEDGTPWALPVRIQKQDRGVFEWDSRMDAVHSRAIDQTAAMAITMFSRDTDSFGQFGFYAQGKGVKLSEKEHGMARYQFIAETTWINDHTFKKREVQL